MSEDNKEAFIRPLADEETTFSRLMEKTLEDVQHLSGNVWTDFNPHDPGVTTAEVANYALAELEYKLGFPLEDYLTREGENFHPERFGLFSAEDVASSAPVTLEDYQKLLLDAIPEIERVRVSCSEKIAGALDISYQLSELESGKSAIVAARIKEVMNANRNLCELLGDVSEATQPLDGEGSLSRTAEPCVKPDVEYKGHYHNIFSHRPLSADFPLCYRLSEKRNPLTSFDAYLKLFDKVICDTLEEARLLPDILDISEENEASFRYDKRTLLLKSQYLDFLDSIYGVCSQPDFVKENEGYGELPVEALHRRMGFLRNVARMQRDRSKARNIAQRGFGSNIPVAKEWFCRLLGIPCDEDKTVGNVLPSYNLRLTEASDPKEQWLLDADSALILERMLAPDRVMMIDMAKQPEDEDPRDVHARLRQELHIFGGNALPADLFRGGTVIDNYRIVSIGPNDYMLVYHRLNRGIWINVGRASDPIKLNSLAKALCRFLKRLNRDCETLYVFEPILVDEKRPFELELVLPNWTNRFHSARFRGACEHLLRSIIPAHLTFQVHWLGQKEMQGFENCYRALMSTLCKSDSEKQCAAIYDLIKRVLA